MVWQANGDYNVYRQDGSLWYVCPKSAFEQWGIQARKMQAEREKNAEAWKRLERDKAYQQYVKADLARQATLQGFVPSLTREEYDASGNF